MIVKTGGLVQAVLNVMNEVNGIEKNLKVGTGGSSYKGVADKDVKQTIGKAMRENGLIILPIGVEDQVDIKTWEEETSYGKKMKKSIHTTVKTRYLLMHKDGESQEIAGYGQGIDTQDKGAGKATTYALKYALLYMFLVPTGDIDDTDKTHSNDIANKVVPTPFTDDDLKRLSEKNPFKTAADAIKAIGKKRILTDTDKEAITFLFD